jgi:hypothetical protein
MLCECGCGQYAGVYSATNRHSGKDKRFINGHASKGKTLKAHCVRGHPRTKENLWSNGSCKLCHSDSTSKTKLWAKTPKGKTSIKNTALKLNYGLNLEKYEEILKVQNGKCKICPTVLDSSCKALIPCVDHAHDETRKVRGLLCTRCNLAIGQFNDSTELLEKAIQYLKETQ